MVTDSRPKMGQHRVTLPWGHHGTRWYVFLALGSSRECIQLTFASSCRAGYKIDSIQKDVVEMKVTYDAYGLDDDPIVLQCGINNTYNADHDCNITLTVPRDMNPPILIHYELDNFYQNHRSYYTNRDEFQLRGDTTEGDDLYCSPLHKLGNISLNPCGLTANTMFNDIITLVEGKDRFGVDLRMIEEGIAWGTDLEYQFKPARGFKKELCPESVGCTPECCEGDDWSCNEPAIDDKDGGCYRYFYPNEDTVQYLYETYPKIVSPLEHVQNEHFVVWMRIAVNSNFRKLYGWIDQPIAAGETLTFQINNNYVVQRFRGSKSLIVGTTSIFGGRNDTFSLVFLGPGYFFIIAGLFFGFKLFYKPRKLADPAFLHIKED